MINEEPHFLFQPGEWLGYGEVVVSSSPEKLRFHVEWKIESADAKKVKATQRVDIAGNEPMTNTFTVAQPEGGKFTIALVNGAIGSFSGTGMLDSSCVAWEFRHDDIDNEVPHEGDHREDHEADLEGYEVYERLSQDEYTFRAEYLGQDERTNITGRLWRREKR